MATLHKRVKKLADGKERSTWIIQFFAPDGKRRTISLSNAAESTAEDACLHVGNLADARRDGLAIDPKTNRWLSGVRGPLRKKLIDFGLVTKPIDATIGGYTRAYIDGRKDLRPMSKTNLEQARRYLVERFGEEKLMAGVSQADADGYRRWLREKLGENTTRRHCGRAKQFFRAACRGRLIDENPFADMKQLTVGASAPERDYFVTREEADQVLRACRDPQWQLLFALSRFGGLRCPSEHRELTWGDVDWEQRRMLVRSPKTERHQGKESRHVPIVPELLPYLREAYGSGGRGGAEFVVTIPALRRDRYANVRTRLEQIIVRAGLTPWPKLWHNLRASCETELAAHHPEHVVVAWMGNSQRVARKHYLRVTDADFERAAAGPALHMRCSPPLPPPANPLPVEGRLAAPDGWSQQHQHPRQDSNLRPRD